MMAHLHVHIVKDELQQRFELQRCEALERHQYSRLFTGGATTAACGENLTTSLPLADKKILKGMMNCSKKKARRKPYETNTVEVVGIEEEVVTNPLLLSPLPKRSAGAGNNSASKTKVAMDDNKEKEFPQKGTEEDDQQTDDDEEKRNGENENNEPEEEVHWMTDNGIIKNKDSKFNKIHPIFQSYQGVNTQELHQCQWKEVERLYSSKSNADHFVNGKNKSPLFTDGASFMARERTKGNMGKRKKNDFIVGANSHRKSSNVEGDNEQKGGGSPTSSDKRRQLLRTLLPVPFRVFVIQEHSQREIITLEEGEAFAVLNLHFRDVLLELAQKLKLKPSLFYFVSPYSPTSLQQLLKKNENEMGEKKKMRIQPVAAVANLPTMYFGPLGRRHWAGPLVTEEDMRSVATQVARRKFSQSENRNVVTSSEIQISSLQSAQIQHRRRLFAIEKEKRKALLMELQISASFLQMEEKKQGCIFLEMTKRMTRILESEERNFLEMEVDFLRGKYHLHLQTDLLAQLEREKAQREEYEKILAEQHRIQRENILQQELVWNDEKEEREKIQIFVGGENENEMGAGGGEKTEWEQILRLAEIDAKLCEERRTERMKYIVVWQWNAESTFCSDHCLHIGRRLEAIQMQLIHFVDLSELSQAVSQLCEPCRIEASKMILHGKKFLRMAVFFKLMTRWKQKYKRILAGASFSKEEKQQNTGGNLVLARKKSTTKGVPSSCEEKDKPALCEAMLEMLHRRLEGQKRKLTKVKINEIETRLLPAASPSASLTEKKAEELVQEQEVAPGGKEEGNTAPKEENSSWGNKMPKMGGNADDANSNMSSPKRWYSPKSSSMSPSSPSPKMLKKTKSSKNFVRSTVSNYIFYLCPICREVAKGDVAALVEYAKGMKLVKQR